MFRFGNDNIVFCNACGVMAIAPLVMGVEFIVWELNV